MQLIASDIDGTLLPYGTAELEPRVFDAIRTLHAQGIAFCAASGRQYSSLRRLFAPVADEIYYLCENGGVVYSRGTEETARVLFKTAMPRAICQHLVAEIVAHPDCEVVISGVNMAYVMPKGTGIIDNLNNVAHNRYTCVKSFDEVREDIVKISAFCPSANALYPQFQPRWREHFSVAEAGAEWLDFTLANKGTGMHGLCEALGLSPAQVVAFGDNYNDVAMLEAVGEPYIMSTAAAPLRARFVHQCENVADALQAFAARQTEKTAE